MYLMTALPIILPFHPYDAFFLDIPVPLIIIATIILVNHVLHIKQNILYRCSL